MDVDAAMQSQIRNIEATYSTPLDHWFTVIDTFRGNPLEAWTLTVSGFV